MHDERTNYQFTTNFEDEENMTPDTLTEESVKQYMEELARLQETYVAKAGEILTPAQLKQFRSSQEQMRAMQEMGLKMAAQMFGTQTESEPAKAPPD